MSELDRFFKRFLKFIIIVTAICIIGIFIDITIITISNNPYDKDTVGFMDYLAAGIRSQLFNDEVYDDEQSVENLKVLFDGEEHKITEIDESSRFGKNVLIFIHYDSFEEYEKNFRIGKGDVYCSLIYKPDNNVFEILVHSAEDDSTLNCIAYPLNGELDFDR